MTALARDSERQRAEQRQSWDGVAAGWAKWWEFIEAGSRPVSERLIELAGIAPGSRVLDIATGNGEPAITAARRVGPEGRVLATDFAPSMLAQGRARARDLGLDNIEFREMDAAEIQLAETGFDAVLCRWGLMFVPDLDLTLGAVHGLLKPGGRLAIAIWDGPDEVPMISLPGRVLTEQLDLPPPAPDQPTPFSLSNIAALQDALRAAGFASITSEAVNVIYRFPSAEDFVTFRREATSVEARLTGYSPEQRERAWDAVIEAVRQFATPDGGIAIPNKAFCLGAERRTG
jgi:ubiquinone/menaquinone biosynthesis C-methylase UbiE